MDVDNSGEMPNQGGELESLSNGLEQSGALVEDEAWEEYGCILWDLAASKMHAELMVNGC